MSIKTVVQSLVSAFDEARAYLPKRDPNNPFGTPIHLCGVNKRHTDGSLLPFAPNLDTLSAHDTIALSICEKGIHKALDALHALMADTPGGQCWYPKLSVQLTKPDTFTIGLSEENKSIQTMIRGAEIEDLMATLMLALMMGNPGEPITWTYGTNGYVYKAADLGSATILGAVLYDYRSARDILAGEQLPQPVNRYYPPSESLEALRHNQRHLFERTAS